MIERSEITEARMDFMLLVVRIPKSLYTLNAFEVKWDLSVDGFLLLVSGFDHS